MTNAWKDWCAAQADRLNRELDEEAALEAAAIRDAGWAAWATRTASAYQRGEFDD